MSLRLIASIHDVAPSTLHSCAELRDVVRAHAKGPVSLLVVPRYHGAERWSDLSLQWLRNCAAEGDEIVLHGETHLAQGGENEREFAGLDERSARRRLMAGLAELGSVGLPLRGFVSPCYAHPRALSAACENAGLTWWATRNVLHWVGGGAPLFSLGFGTSTPLRRRLSPTVADRTAYLLATAPTIRLDLHPGDADDPGLLHWVDRVIGRLVAQGRALTTHEALVPGPVFQESPRKVTVS